MGLATTKDRERERKLSRELLEAEEWAEKNERSERKEVSDDVRNACQRERRRNELTPPQFSLGHVKLTAL